MERFNMDDVKKYLKINSVKEHYGDPHLHHSEYQNGQCPQSCGTGVNYEHANLCGSTPYGSELPYKNKESYDCGCNLCQAPYSVPYATGKGGFMGDMLQFRPCKNPYCRCTDCEGNCKCGAGVVVVKEGFVDMGDNSLTNLLLLLGVAAVIYFFLYKKNE